MADRLHIVDVHGTHIRGDVERVLGSVEPILSIGPAVARFDATDLIDRAQLLRLRDWLTSRLAEGAAELEARVRRH